MTKRSSRTCKPRANSLSESESEVEAGSSESHALHIECCLLWAKSTLVSGPKRE